jgi:hypothetical protein
MEIFYLEGLGDGAKPGVISTEMIKRGINIAKLRYNRLHDNSSSSTANGHYFLVLITLLFLISHF